jgi:hypothetical protein
MISLKNILSEAYTSLIPGNSGRTTTHLDNKKYQLTKDVKGARIGDYINVVLPKGSIIHNLRGGVFANHPTLKTKYSTGYKSERWDDKFGVAIKRMPDTLIAIEKSSKILESIVNEDCWKGYEQIGMKDKGGKEVPNCVPIKEEMDDDYDELDVEDDDEEDFLDFLKNYTTEINEAEYQGREVKLGKPMQGDVKKFKVYVKNPKTGKVIKVNFGQKGMVIKKDNPAARKSFRARMNCDNPGPRTKANYWSCRKW